MENDQNINIQEFKEFKTPEKIVQRNSVPLYSTIFLSNLKSKYKIKKICTFNSLSKNNESTETSGLTRINSNNFSNIQLVSLSNRKQKKKVSFAPPYRLVNYIYFDPKKSVFNNNEGENEENDGKKNETNAVCAHCTCIII